MIIVFSKRGGSTKPTQHFLRQSFKMSNETLQERSCQQWRRLFSSINNYFRDDMVLNGTEYSSMELGYAITIAYFFVITFGAAGNVLTILAVIRNPQMRTTRNFFIVNLALSDFFICTVTAPITLYTVLFTFWPFGTAFCKIVGSLEGFNIFLSTFSIAAIALDRYVLVIFPTKRDRQHNLSLIFFALIWLISIVFALPLLIASDLNVIFEDVHCGISLKICHEQNEIWQTMPINKETYTIAVLFTQYALPLCSIVFVYSRIAHRMQMRLAGKNSPFVHSAASSQRRRSVVERQRRTHLLLGCVVGVFAIAWLPLNVFHLVNTFGWVKRFSVPTFALCHVFAIGSACLNPVSYAFFNHNFRHQFSLMFQAAGISDLRQVFACVRVRLTKSKSSKKSPKARNGSIRQSSGGGSKEAQGIPKENSQILRSAAYMPVVNNSVCQATSIILNNDA
ncbi:hypothetical protein L596_004018 [Steinernema carpocapsae]|uniref:G-protein coupled receptors family 1 profile domain-containing protein n=1 Tax=Steinernema carpocapsae TaxID=34508 RepID=A0A4U8UUC3_STECR|nr:hypothetical protein L596_004018 [Steinernema carpocapsae]